MQLNNATPHGRSAGAIARSLSVLLLATLWGCGSPTFDPGPPPAPRDRGTVELDESEPPTLVDIERHQFSRTARDPFSPPFLTEAGPGLDRAVEMDCDPATNPLGLFEARQLRLLGLITGTPVPRALIVPPGTSQAIIATEGARIGPRCTRRIEVIRDNEVVISTFGDEDDRRRVILVLSEQPIDAEVERNGNDED
ncbi:MAG: hypothetical protein EA398_09630 [Deltaproteobacteria bacterium]|nr:MAG: hypothetical protein EA398_09630 [Deltaproteobacteria bacterium]